MTPSEATGIYDALLSILRESGLDWVSTQVLQQVALGRTGRKRISVFGEDYARVGPGRRQQVEFLSTLPYTPQEQLQLLLDAIEQTVVATAEIQRSTFKMLSVDRDLLDIKFAPEAPLTQEHGYRREESELRAGAVSKLHTLLNELREELRHAD